MRRVLQRQQGMTEYIVIVGVIALLLIGSLKLFRGKIKGSFDTGSGTLQAEIVDGLEAGSRRSY